MNEAAYSPLRQSSSAWKEEHEERDREEYSPGEDSLDSCFPPLLRGASHSLPAGEAARHTLRTLFWPEQEGGGEGRRRRVVGGAVELSVVVFLASVGCRVAGQSPQSAELLVGVCLWVAVTYVVVARPAARCVVHSAAVLCGRGAVWERGTSQEPAADGNHNASDFDEFDAVGELKTALGSVVSGEDSRGLGHAAAQKSVSPVEIWSNVLPRQGEAAYNILSTYLDEASLSRVSFSEMEVKSLLYSCWVRCQGEKIKVDQLSTAGCTDNRSLSAINEKLLFLFFTDLLPLDVSFVVECMKQSSPWTGNECKHSNCFDVGNKSDMTSRVYASFFCLAYALACLLSVLFMVNCDNLMMWCTVIFGYFTVTRCCVVNPLHNVLIQFVFPLFVTDDFFRVRHNCLIIVDTLLKRRLNVNESLASGNNRRSISSFFFVSKSLAKSVPHCAMGSALRIYEPCSTLLFAQLRLLPTMLPPYDIRDSRNMLNKGAGRVTPFDSSVQNNISEFSDNGILAHENLGECETRSRKDEIRGALNCDSAFSTSEVNDEDLAFNSRGVDVPRRQSDLVRLFYFLICYHCCLRKTLATLLRLLINSEITKPTSASKMCRKEHTIITVLLLIIDSVSLILINILVILPGYYFLQVLPVINGCVLWGGYSAMLLIFGFLVACLSRCAISWSFHTHSHYTNTFSLNMKCLGWNGGRLSTFESSDGALSDASSKKSDDDYIWQENRFEQVSKGEEVVSSLNLEVLEPKNSGANENFSQEEDSMVQSYVKALTVREVYDTEKMEQYKEQLLKRVVAKVQLKQRLHNESLRKHSQNNEGEDEALPKSSRPLPKVVISSIEAIDILQQSFKIRKAQEIKGKTISAEGTSMYDGVDVRVDNEAKQGGKLSEERVTDIRKRAVQLTHAQSVATYSENLASKKNESQARLHARLSQRRGNQQLESE